ncbi:ATP-binding cassette domain-containing protein [Derxia gummosa]|uniref:ATP-binding cassette domain-containing protein n=1 Tax=Derxia gummosa DSM 723 TaxID=1121388 RepID=A0A8B6X7G1_9BURK|nr:ABC transporter ATP-binding protein [Derxia gummosa]
MRRLYLDLWRLAAGLRGRIVLAFTALLLSQGAKLAVPWLSGKAINTLQARGLPGLHDAALWLLAVLGATALGWCLHGPGRILERNVALAVRQRLAAELVGDMFRLPLGWHVHHHSGETSHRVRQTTEAMFNFAQSQFILLQNAAQVIGPIVALWLIERTVGMVAMAGFALIWLVIVLFDRRMMVLAREENATERRYQAALNDSFGNLVSVLALRQMQGVAALLERRLLAIYEPLRKSIVVNEGKWCSVDLLSQTLACGLVGLYAWLAARGITAAEVMPAARDASAPTLALGSVVMVFAYANQAAGVITSIAAHYQSFARHGADYASADPIREAVAAETRAAGEAEARDAAARPAGATARTADVAPADATDTRPAAARDVAAAVPAAAASSSAVLPPAGWRQLELRALRFRYPKSDGGLDLDRLVLERGRRYALIGGSGSGKSTLLWLLSGLYRPEQGELHADGHRVTAEPRRVAAGLLSLATLIPQDAEVFEGTLGENLELAATHAGPVTRAELPRALATACADVFLLAEAEKPGAGLDAQVAERGANWSGGQRQRIALARGVAAAADSSIVLLDEPTAALDPATEARVYANLFERFGDACVISSIHRLHLLDHFDEVLVMDHGRLVDRGAPAEVLARRKG